MVRIILIHVFIVFTFAIHAQTKKVYMSKQGGKPRILYAGKLGYYELRHLMTDGNSTDSLICRGKGWERARLERAGFYQKNDEKGNYLEATNAAIKKVDKHIKKTKTTEGEVSLLIKNQKVMVRYKNADFKGNSDMDIELF